MKTFKKVLTDAVDTLQCDVCARKVSLDQDTGNIMEAQEFTSIEFTGGYASVFGDMNRIQLDICQHCLKERLGQFVRVTNYEDSFPPVDDEEGEGTGEPA